MKKRFLASRIAWDRGASRGMRLFRMGRNEVRIVATSANRTDMMRLWSLPILALFDPGLGTRLHRVPGTADWRSVAKVKFVQVVYAHAVKQGGAKDVNAFGDI